MSKLGKLQIFLCSTCYAMNKEKSLFPDPEDEISKAWIEAVIRGRLSEFSDNSIFCLGPPSRNIKQINGYNVCGNTCSVKTHVQNEFVAFCEDHIVILHNYITKNPSDIK